MAGLPLQAPNRNFDDVFDYLEKVRARKAGQPLKDAQAKNELAQASRNEELAKLPFGGREMPGAAGKALAVEMIKRKYGENSPEYQSSKKLYDLETRRAEQTMAYQQSLMDTQGKRFATPEGKRAQEEAEISHGVMPGSAVGNREGTLLSPEQKERLSGMYKLKDLKDVTDTGVRQRILYSKNMEKTLGTLNVNDLTTYSGLKGATDLLKDSAASAHGNAPPRYIAYKEALVNADTLAKQVRQFYGDSITPTIQNDLKKLTNPTSWLEDPKSATARFNKFKSILKTESKTFTSAAKNADIYDETPEDQAPTAQPAAGLTYNPQTGEFE